MKILLLAYACEPHRGSEPGVGWKWALNMSKDPNKDIYVLTRSNNKGCIDKYWAYAEKPGNLHFCYYDLPSPLIWAKHHGLPVNLYYAWWLCGAVKCALVLHKKINFDMAHHLTFGVFRNPSALYKLNIPYVIGPVGGGEFTPSLVLPLYSLNERIKEVFRSFANKISMMNPFVHKSFNKASLILTKAKETKDVLNRWESKTFVNLEIGVDSIYRSDACRNKDVFLFVGRFTYWKGVKLVLKSFEKYSKIHSNARLLMIGKGEMQCLIEQYAKKNNLNIEIIPWIKQDELKMYYSTACAMVFPSLHDSSGNVVLEALSCGLPVVCLDCGGPASILGDSLKELVVSTQGNSIDDIVSGIVMRMDRLFKDVGFYSSVQERAYQRAESLLWKNTVDETYSLVEKYLVYKG